MTTTISFQHLPTDAKAQGKLDLLAREVEARRALVGKPSGAIRDWAKAQVLVADALSDARFAGKSEMSAIVELMGMAVERQTSDAKKRRFWQQVAEACSWAAEKI